MKQKNTSISIFVIPEVEKRIEKLDTDLIADASLKARQRAKLAEEITAAEFKSIVSDPIQDKCQKEIDYVGQQCQLDSNFHNTNEAEIKANQQSLEWQFEYNRKEELLEPLQKRLDEISYDPDGGRKTLLFLAICILVGMADGVLAFYSYRNSYDFLMSLILSVAVGTAIAVGHKGITPWLKASTKKSVEWIKIIAVALVGFCFFYFIANMRVDALKSVVDTTVTGSLSVTGNHLNT